MSAPAKSPLSKTKNKKKGGKSLILPGLDKLPTNKKGGKPVVVVVVKGGKKPPNLSNLPFLMGGKKKKKKTSKASKKSKKSVKSVDKKRTNKTGEDDSLSESDRVSAPDLPKVHTKKASTPVRSDKSVTGATSTSTSTTSIASIPTARTPQLSTSPQESAALKSVRSSPSKALSPAKAPVVIQGGIVDQPCVPMFVLIEGPAGCPIIVPLDARDESGLAPEAGPQPLRTAPSEDTKGYLVVEDGLLHFKPLKECPQPPANSTAGTLTKFLSNSNIFIADSGPELPDKKEINTAASATIKEKIGVKLAVTGHITILADKGTCKFTRVAAVSKPPLCPDNGAMGVLVKDTSTSHLFWVPTENRFVGPLLSKNVKITPKPAKEMAIVGNVYKDSNGIITCESSSNKLDNLIGFIMSSATGVPMYAAKPEGVSKTVTPVPVDPTPTAPAATTLPTPTEAAAAPLPTPVAAASTPITTPAAAAAAPPPAAEAEEAPKPAAEEVAKPAVAVADPPPSRDEISPPPTRTPIPAPPPVLSPTPSSTPAESPPPVVEDAPPLPPAPAAPSLGWSLLSTLGSVLTTTASVISTTAGAVTEAASGAGASLPPSTQSAAAPSVAQSPAVPSVSPVPSPSSPRVSSPAAVPPKTVQTRAVTTPTVPVPIPVVAKATPAKSAKTPAKEKPAPAPAAADDEEGAEESAARVADDASNGRARGTTGVTINITVRDSNSNGGKIIRDSNSNGGKIADQKSGSGETFSDCNSEGGVGIGDQMASIYRNLLSSQNELPPDAEEEHKEEESRREEKVETKARSSVSEESRRKAENIKEYKKYKDDRSEYFNPYGYR